MMADLTQLHIVTNVPKMQLVAMTLDLQTSAVQNADHILVN